MSIIFLILAVLSSLSIAVLLRNFEFRGANRVVIIAFNYITAGTLGLWAGIKPVSGSIYFFGSILGLFFVVAFILFSKAIKLKGIASTVTIGRLSLAVPVLASILFWGEQPDLLEIGSLLIIFFIIFLWEGKIGKISLILITIFMLFGSIDTSIKFFKIKFPVSDDGSFLVVIFYSAAVWSWIYLIYKKEKIKQKDLISGLFLGIPNYFSTYFLLKSLELAPAYVTFPFINIGLIVSSGLIGHFLFKEQLSKKKILLMAMGIIAVFFLTS